MLELRAISKSYKTANFTQTALDRVTLSFRDNEFVAILGPSGSGKTTLLNIVGGLDHYDSGNLIIDGIATEQYRARDWDAYRNNRIGFVFQSYNLIPHQTVLANVELALTLSGVGRSERKRRAYQALREVGLGDHIAKKPSQLSGGQMQRVAIARALINDPEILLADEPTGALDSKTSVQIMNLLTEIAHDRLVIMVTHNPELAKTYATRIVTLADGIIQSDTHPLTDEERQEVESKKPVRKTKMSFLTALSLSFKNLMTKKGRTIMTAFAGSIGIIGIAAILALANGVNNYIKSVEENTLSEYPLSIQKQGFDLSSLYGMPGGSPGASGSDDPNNPTAASDTKDTNDSGNQVGEYKMVSQALSKIGTNDLASLKKFLDDGGNGINQYVNAIQYNYDVTPQIYSSDTSKGVRQINPDSSFSSLAGDASSATQSVASSTINTNVFSPLVDDTHLVESQYDVVAGSWPKDYNQVLLVLNKQGDVSDMMLYDMGLRDTKELDTMVAEVNDNKAITPPSDSPSFSYDQLMQPTFKLVDATSYYQYDPTYHVWKDKRKDSDYLKQQVDKGTTLHISGIIRPKKDVTTTALSPGLYYTSGLTKHLIDDANASQIVKDQKADPKTDVFTGKSFDDEQKGTNNNFDLSSLFTIDGQQLQAAISIDPRALSVDMSQSLDLQKALSNLPPPPQPQIADVAKAIPLKIPTDKVANLMSTVMQDYANYLQKFYLAHSPLLPDGTKNPHYDPQVKPLTPTQYLAQPSVQDPLTKKLQGLVNVNALETQVSHALQNYVQTTLSTYMTSMVNTLQTQVTQAMQQSLDQMAQNLSHAMHIDPSAFKKAIHMNMSQQDLTDLMLSLMNTEKVTYDGNLKKLGYADTASPSSIDIYPSDFKAKTQVVTILNDYNKNMKANGETDKVISYTDVVGTLMSSVTTIVDMISYVLIAFVAISLIVSSIMIGIITYISVLERKKEIGILRSIGASKGDIGRVFNAETIIVGFAAGLIGIGLTLLASLPVNAVVDSLFKVSNVAALPWQAGLILIGISVLLTFLAGLIPSSAASRKDPVEALRSE